MQQKTNPAPLAGGYRAGTRYAVQAPSTREILRNQAQPRPAAGDGRATRVIVRLMRDNEVLRDENRRLRIALRGYDSEQQSPFPPSLAPRSSGSCTLKASGPWK